MRLEVVLLGILSGCAARAPIAVRSPPANERPQVIIVGGGLAGLVAAYELEKRGVTIHLLEMSDRLGGRVGTARYGDQLYAEYGMQEIWEKSPLAGIARELGLQLTAESAYSSVLIDGRIYPFGRGDSAEFFRRLFTPDELMAQQQWLRKCEAIYEKLSRSGVTSALERLNELSFAEWMREEQLPPRVQEWIRLTLESELGTNAESFSALSGIAEFRMFLFGGETAFHVVGGNSRLIQRLAAAIHGPKTLLAHVTEVRRRIEANGIVSSTVTYLKGDRSQTLSAERVLVAVPWFVLHQIQFDPPLRQETRQAIDGLGRGQYTVVHLLVDREIAKLWGSDELFPILSGGPLGVIYGVSVESSSADLRVFSLLVYGEYARAFHMVPQDQKRADLLAELDKIWPGFSSHVRSTAIYPYHPAAVPFWPPGRSPYDAQSQQLFKPMTGLYLAGDYLVSSHSEGAVRSALRQAISVAEGLGR